MSRFSVRHILYLVVDCLLLLGCLLNAPRVMERARAPFSVTQDGEDIIITAVTDSSAAGTLREWDRIISWNTRKVSIPEMIEFNADISHIGDRAVITVDRPNGPVSETITLIPYYPSPRFLIVSLSVGFLTWLVGLFILTQRLENIAADILHGALVALGSAIMCTWGHIDPGSVFSGVSRSVFFISYTAAPALFVLFAAQYPHPLPVPLRTVFALVLLVTLPIIAAQSYFMAVSIYDDPEHYFPLFQQSFDTFNGYLLLCFVLMVAGFYRSYRLAVRVPDKRKLEWILWGFCASPIPFLLFVKLPGMAGIQGGLVDEELTTVFFLLIPFACAVSLVQHTWVDIRLVISRSIMYAVLSLIVGAIYTLTILLAATSIDTHERFEEYLLVALIVIAMMLVLDRLRFRLYRMFDELLFPARMMFRRSTAGIHDALQGALSPDDVFTILQHHLRSIVPFGSFELFRYHDGILTKIGPHGGGEVGPLPFSETRLADFNGRSIAARPEALQYRSDEKIVYDSRIPETLGCMLCVIMVSDTGRLLGVAAGSPSQVTGQFTEEETDLLSSMCAEAAGSLSRLFLQEEVILQRSEKQRLEELSRVQSFFVSSVSHELRTPLTSIRMFAELLRRRKGIPGTTRQEYLQIIEGESERLTRLVDTVLDFSAIERRTKEYRFSETDLAEVIRRSVSAVQYQFMKQQGKLTVTVARGIPRIQADPDALEEVCINLLSNALKYSTERRSVRISAGTSGRSAVITVSDRGIGIPKDEIGRIFDDFYRVNDPAVKQAGGTGLGLSVVKHIIEAHGGTIAVRSTVGKGSTFTVRLPLSHRRRS